MAKIRGQVKLKKSSAGLDGVIIRLSGEDNAGAPVSVETTTAHINGKEGAYVFDGLNPGEYTVTLDLASLEKANPNVGPETDSISVDLETAGEDQKAHFLVRRFKIVSDPIANDADDLALMRALLVASTEVLDEWVNRDGVQKTRKRLRHIFAKALLRKGEDECEFPILRSVQAAAPLADLDTEALPCATCWQRYNTPGTIYHQNSYYLNQCLYQPPCT
jgi:hypothetical protein